MRRTHREGCGLGEAEQDGRRPASSHPFSIASLILIFNMPTCRCLSVSRSTFSVALAGCLEPFQSLRTYMLSCINNVMLAALSQTMYISKVITVTKAYWQQEINFNISMLRSRWDHKLRQNVHYFPQTPLNTEFEENHLSHNRYKLKTLKNWLN